MPGIIKPTVGRKVWFQPNGINVINNHVVAELADQPMDATVVCVWDDRSVNLRLTDHVGHTHRAANVMLLQEDDEPPETNTPYCMWMPYQQGQAKAAAAIETPGVRNAH